MTRGEALPHLWAFALPVLLGNWLQLMYNAVDAMLAGQFIGRDALAAEGIAAPVMNLVILGVSGLCTGAGVLMSEHFGAGRLPALRRTLGALIRFGLIASLALVILGWALSPLLGAQKRGKHPRAAAVPHLFGPAERWAGPVFPGRAAFRRHLQRGHHRRGGGGQRRAGLLVHATPCVRAVPGRGRPCPGSGNDAEAVQLWRACRAAAGHPAHRIAEADNIRIVGDSASDKKI